MLRNSKLFGQLPPALIAELEAKAQPHEFRAGERIFEEGDPGHGVYVVESGSVELTALLESGARQVFNVIGPGDIFGELAVLDNLPRSARASAQTDARVVFIPRAELVELVRKSPELSLLFMQEVSGRLREFNRHYLREVLQAERMAVVGRFASAIVHDLKNPLGVISLAASIASSPKSDEANRKMARENINKQIERITNLVNDILEYTRGESIQQKFPEIYLHEFIEQIVHEFRDELALRSVQFVLENEPPPMVLPINEKRLMRVFFNLFSNAADEMPSGGKIYLRFESAPAEVTIEIEDSGKGIAPEIIERLFEPFATYGKTKGTGLGLSIAQRIIEEHQGKISARNSCRGGAVFRFTLPGKRSSGASMPGQKL